MRGSLRLIVIALSLAHTLSAQSSSPGSRTGSDPHPLTPGLDINSLDRNTDPCVDFYQYACGKWLANNPIPPDQSRWMRFFAMMERNRLTLRNILEEASVPRENRSTVEQKIGDYYASCMDETAVEGNRLQPLEPELKRIAALRRKAELPQVLAHLHDIGVNALFRLNSVPDLKNSSQVIAEIDQGGLGLPDRSYYLKTDLRSRELRGAYLGHVQRMFELLGEPLAKATKDSGTVLRIETQLARKSLDRVQRRIPENLYHKTSLPELCRLTPSFPWDQYLTAADAPTLDSVNVAVPGFLRGVDALLRSVSVDDWKVYLRWQLAHSASDFLPNALVQESFNFYGKTLSGIKQPPPRWNRCVQQANRFMGQALGEQFVRKTFSPEDRQRALNLVQAVEKAARQELAQLPWMTDATKKEAIKKLQAVKHKIGFPDKWLDYGALKIVRGDVLGNALRAIAFERRRDLKKVGKPADRDEWSMLPQTVDASAEVQDNAIIVPAGMFQPTMFSTENDDALNYGAVGVTIAHEITHLFDDEGRRFDAEGNLRDWWSAEDARRFESLSECFVDQYSGYVTVDDVHLNGTLTLGENIADNAGVRIALAALLDTLGDKQHSKIDGFTPVQRFFISHGQSWCDNQTDEKLRFNALVDPHAPGRYRVNGVLQNMPEFQRAFGCKPGAPMVRKNVCRVW